MFDHDRRPIEMKCPVLMSATEVPRIVVRPNHVHLDRCIRTSRSMLTGRNVGVYATQALGRPTPDWNVKSAVGANSQSALDKDVSCVGCDKSAYVRRLVA